MGKEITQRIEAWYADRYLREFDPSLCADLLYRLFYEEWGAHKQLHNEFEILGKLFFMSVGNLWRLNTLPKEYEDAIDRNYLLSDSGPFGNRQPVETSIEWIISRINRTHNENQVRKYSLVLLDAVLELFAVNCKRSQAEAILSAICDYMDCQPKGDPCSDDYFGWDGMTELSDSLKEIASNSGKTQYRVVKPGIYEVIPEKFKQ